MTKQLFMPLWDHLRQANGIAMRCVQAVPADKLDSHPIPKMRTPKELIVHFYGMAVRAVVEGTLRGEIEDIDEPRICSGIKTRDDLLAYCRECWNAADKAVSQMTDAHFTASVKTPWDMSLPGIAALGITHDELMHHRGQLYVYLRAMGQDVPMMWDFEHNAPEYRAKAAARA